MLLILQNPVFHFTACMFLMVLALYNDFDISFFIEFELLPRLKLLSWFLFYFLMLPLVIFFMIEQLFYNIF